RNDFDYVLTSVLIAPDFRMAILQPREGGDPIRVRVGTAPEAAPAWRLASLEPRSAVFDGPGGERTLELRVSDGEGGIPPTQPSAGTNMPGASRPAPPDIAPPGGAGPAVRNADDPAAAPAGPDQPPPDAAHADNRASAEQIDAI